MAPPVLHCVLIIRMVYQVAGFSLTFQECIQLHYAPYWQYLPLHQQPNDLLLGIFRCDSFSENGSGELFTIFPSVPCVPCGPCLLCLPCPRTASSSFWSLLDILCKCRLDVPVVMGLVMPPLPSKVTNVTIIHQLYRLYLQIKKLVVLCQDILTRLEKMRRYTSNP